MCKPYQNCYSCGHSSQALIEECVPNFREGGSHQENFAAAEKSGCPYLKFYPMGGRNKLYCCTTKCCEKATREVKTASDIAKRNVERMKRDKRKSISLEEVDKMMVNYQNSLTDCEREEVKHAACREGRGLNT